MTRGFPTSYHTGPRGRCGGDGGGAVDGEGDRGRERGIGGGNGE